MLTSKTLFTSVLLLLVAVVTAVGQPKTQAKKEEEDPFPSDEKEFEQQYQQRIKQERLNGVYIPKNLDEACSQLDKLISDESKAVIRTIPEDSVVLKMQNRLGRWIIMNWGFYGGSRLSHYLRSAGVTFPDDMADFVVLAYHRKLNNKPVNIRELATNFRGQRKEEWEKEKKEGKVISETKRKVKPGEEPAKKN